MHPRRRFVAQALAVAYFQILALPTVASADVAFKRVGDIPLNANWVSRAESGWLISLKYSWFRFDEDFNEVAYGSSPELRGIDWDPTRQLVFYSEPFNRDIAYARPDGTWLGSFKSTDFVNGLSVNPTTGDIWLASFSGLVERVDNNGDVLQSFVAPFNLTGVAVDPLRNTLYLMRADGLAGVGGAFDDEVYEFSYNGANLGLVLPVGSFNPQAIGNGIGLDFVPETGLLYVSGLSTTQVFQRVPEPASCLLLALGLMVPVRRRR